MKKDFKNENNITGADLKNLDYLEKTGIKKLNIAIMNRLLTKNIGKVFNDSIHGHIELHPLLVKIIDTAQFQRLRNIKQLGGAYFVFPGASHNRFEHSIGVGHLAGEFAKALKSRQPELDISDTDILCVQIAGLCHDLGHGPFSHLYDGMFNLKAAKDKTDANWKHEDASLVMFDYLVDANGLKSEMQNYGLNPKDLIFIKELISGRPLKHGSSENTASKPWPYEGRAEDKSFLYEIVANKLNGIDVDKFDYFARDCHHLGIQRNFDHLRFFMFARVCEVDGRRHICSRDKEVGNLYDMFHMRNCLHRRAYKHRVNTNIEIMITDSLLKADQHIKIEGLNGKKFTLSQARSDPEAYTKLTDQVLEKILHPCSCPCSCSCSTSSASEMDKARQIIQRIIFRHLYEFLGEAKKKENQGEKKGEKIPEEKVESLKEELAKLIPEGQQKEDNFEVIVVTLDYGMKDKDPINNTYFYKKTDVSRGHKIPKNQVSKLLPECFSEEIIRVYWKNQDAESQNAKKCFTEWCTANDFEMVNE